jgi:RNA polymerase sigma-70 factor (ECF subfamily)
MPATDSTARSVTTGVEPEQRSTPGDYPVPSFARVYNEYFGFVWSCVRRLGVGADELDDVVQDVFIVIHARLSTLQQPESIRSWIYGITRRTASTYHRAKRAKMANSSALDAQTDLQYPQPPSPHELAEQSDQVRLLWELLAKLDPAKREVFVLADLDDMTVPEIASALAIPLNTAYSRLRIARQELEEALARHNARLSQRGRTCPT